MTFLVAAALAIGLLVAIPVAAHLLRRGRANEQAFPPAALVPAEPPVARQRSRIEDRALLTLRALMIVALAVLGATPLVRCSRLSLARESGASVALALVVDDSLSMQATVAGRSRWQRAIDGADQLLKSARDGDAVAIILAGRPARLALAGTTDLEAARRALDELKPSDRATDLDGAVQMARSALKQLPQTDKRIALLSDLAGDPIPDGTPMPWLPLPVLQHPVADCGVVSAEQHGKRVTARLACSSAAAARGRTAEAVSGKAEAARRDAGSDAGSAKTPPAGKVLAHSALAPRAGKQTLLIELPSSAPVAEIRLTGQDALAHDDAAPVTAQSSALEVAVVTDVSTGSVTTGGPTILEQALAALDDDSVTRPLALVPDDAHELRPFGALILDDPTGLSPESRSALGQWLRSGGVAMALLGPRAETAELGVTLEPFASGAVHWESPAGSDGIAPKTLSWLGNEAASLGKLHPKGRARLDGAEPPGSHVSARWKDSRPFIFDRQLGRGLVMTVGLPSSASVSDFALRPAFLALLDHVIQEALARTGPRRSLAGSTWSFSSKAVSIAGPDGPVQIHDADGDTKTRSDDSRGPEKVAVVGRLGRYRVKVDGETRTRIVTIDPAEITTAPRKPDAKVEAAAGGNGQARVDASPNVALALLALLALELLLRVAGPLGRGRRRGTRAAAPRA